LALVSRVSCHAFVTKALHALQKRSFRRGIGGNFALFQFVNLDSAGVITRALLLSALAWLIPNQALALETPDKADDPLVVRFSSALGEHGAWFESDLGLVWQPKRASVDSTWRPYSDGRWQWTDAGWTWHSLEPYGWAVYHFGRWEREPKQGWFWVPGDEWAPAWVSWRVSRDGMVGWAPLPATAVGRQFGPNVDEACSVDPMNYVFLPMTEVDELTYFSRFGPVEQQMATLRNSHNVTNLQVALQGRALPAIAGGPDPSAIAVAIRHARQNPEENPVPRLRLALSFATGPGAEKVENGVFHLPVPGSAPDETGAPLVAGRVQLKTAPAAAPAVSKAQQDAWRAQLAAERTAQAAAAAQRQRQRPPVAPIGVNPPAPVPAAVYRPAPAPSRASGLSPARLQPARSLR
jgi:hypothetical protein